MPLSNDDALEMQVCSVILTRNRDEALKLVNIPNIEKISKSLLNELHETATERPHTWLSSVVRASYVLPAWIQFLGQRAVLVSPRLAHWVLRKTRIHHRWY